jgi:2Fe-2S ferredoxin
MISFQLEDRTGEIRTIEIPEDINLNLMEVLKACEYEIEATCGGMALCATCHVEVTEGMDQLSEKTDAELDMLDTLPSSNPKSRLACQIKVNQQLQNTHIKLVAVD